MELFDYNLTAMSPTHSYLEECYGDGFELDLDDEDEEDDEDTTSSLGGRTPLMSDTTDSDATPGDTLVHFPETGLESWAYPMSTGAAGVGVVTRDGEEVGVGSRRDCDQCGKRFSTLSALEKHAIVHNEDRPFRCEECNSGFKLKVGYNFKDFDVYISGFGVWGFRPRGFHPPGYQYRLINPRGHQFLGALIIGEYIPHFIDP